MSAKKREWLNYPDYIRVIAAFMVVAFHFNVALKTQQVFSDTLVFPNTIFHCNLGNIAVSLFFIVSGLSLMYVYGKECNLKNYYKKRFFSIYPMFWLTFIAVYIWKLNLGEIDTSIPRSKFILTFFGMDSYLGTLEGWFLPNYYLVGEWFLGCIIFMYLLFPLISLGVRKKPVLTAIIIAIVWIFSAVFWHSPMKLYWFVPARIPEFAFGMYFIKYFRKIRVQVMLACLAVLIFCMSWNPIVKYSELLLPMLIGPCLFIVLSYFFSKIKNNAVNRGARTVSNYTYAIFLLHHTVLYAVIDNYKGRTFGFIKTWLLFGLCGFWIIVVSFAFYWIYELLKKIPGFIFGNRK